MTIEIGLYFDLRNPRAWHQDPARLYGFTLEMCEEAERLGAGSVWFSEHHLFDDGYLTQPLGFLSAVAARTQRVRLGTAIVIAPLHHPVEIAEQSALVDLLSGGRLELGLGAGYRIPEYTLYGADHQRRYAQTDERAREIRRLLASGGITPAPVQDPVPVWMGYQGPQGAARAGRLGAGLLSANAALYEPYLQGLREAGLDESAARMTGGVQGWVSEDPEADWPVVSRHLAHQLDSYRRHMVEGTGQPAPRPVDPDKVRARQAARGPIDQFVTGTPEMMSAHVTELVGDAPVRTVFLWASLAGMPEDMVARNVTTICSRLGPLLR